MGVEEEILGYLKDRFPQLILDAKIVRPKVVQIKINGSNLLEICLFVKEELGFDHLSCISAVDWKDRYESVYHFTRYADSTMMQVNAVLPHDDPVIESLSKIWRSADFHEREAYDMMGITYKNHPNLVRILLPEDADYFPLRKDFPQEVDRQYISRRKIKGGG